MKIIGFPDLVEAQVVMVVVRCPFTRYYADTPGSLGTKVDWRAREFGSRAHITVLASDTNYKALRIASERGVAVFDSDCNLMNAPEWFS